MNIRKNTSDVYAELERIANANHGQLTPEAVLRNAQAQTSPIHDYFTWNDTEAGKKLRLLEASMLIRSVKVSVEMHDQDKPLRARAFVNVSSNERDEDDKAGPGVYVPLNVALKVPDYRDQMLENAARELASFRQKYAILSELSEVFEAANHFQQRFNLQAA
jgi:hypothetical protein